MRTIVLRYSAPLSDDDLQSPEAIDLGVLPGARACGNCRLFKPVRRDPAGWVGDCKVMPDRGLFPPAAPVCNAFLSRSAPLPRSMPTEKPHERQRATYRPATSSIHPVVKRPDEVLPELADMTREELKDIIREALSETEVRLAPKWEGGVVILKPGNPELQAKELPIDAIFHKVVMVRDRLRVIEAKLNANPKLTDAEKVELQQYVTKCYGSLTSFNLLFAEKDDQFAGDKGKTE